MKRTFYYHAQGLKATGRCVTSEAHGQSMAAYGILPRNQITLLDYPIFRNIFVFFYEKWWHFWRSNIRA